MSDLGATVLFPPPKIPPEFWMKNSRFTSRYIKNFGSTITSEHFKQLTPEIS
jgi:hypothetical protein